jgi:hypothetical protein
MFFEDDITCHLIASLHQPLSLQQAILIAAKLALQREIVSVT